ncbi:MAG: DUF1475 family protein [Thermoanaerobaculia bacterium]
MIVLLRLLFGAILVAMLATTAWASLEANVFTGGAEMLRNRWAVATLADAYFGFLTFFVWVAWRERTMAARAVWFVLIMLLGNIAMSVYMLIALSSIDRTGSLDQLFKRKEAA